MVIRHTMWNHAACSGPKAARARGKILSEFREEIEDFYRRGTMSDALLGLRNGVDRPRDPPGGQRDRVSKGSHYREDGKSSPPNNYSVFYGPGP